MQSLSDKCEAIISLLGFVYQYLDYAPCSERTAPQKWVSEPSPLDPPYVPPPAVNPYCNGRCVTCLAYYRATGFRPDCPPEEKWEREREQIRRQYRVADVEESLKRLAGFDVTLAQAVWAVWVEPWLDPKTEPITPRARIFREGCAWEGLDWLAHDIEGDVPAYGEKVDRLENQIREMASHGYTQRRIVKELRCDRNKVSAILRGQEVRCQCT